MAPRGRNVPVRRRISHPLLRAVSAMGDAGAWGVGRPRPRHRSLSDARPAGPPSRWCPGNGVGVRGAGQAYPASPGASWPQAGKASCGWPAPSSGPREPCRIWDPGRGRPCGGRGPRGVGPAPQPSPLRPCLWLGRAPGLMPVHAPLHVPAPRPADAPQRQGLPMCFPPPPRRKMPPSAGGSPGAPTLVPAGRQSLCTSTQHSGLPEDRRTVGQVGSGQDRTVLPGASKIAGPGQSR